MSRLILVGCGAKKVAHRAPARDLYRGPLFRSAARYAEATGDPWWIASAGHGLVHPDQELEPYNARLQDQPEVDQAAWAITVVHRILDELPDEARLREVVVELHMGKGYADRLFDVLVATGLTASWPVKGLNVYTARRWYSDHTPRPVGAR